ncbi:MAG: fibronectin type III domain-containing protein [Tepidanaerobacteraceae bacterium]
MKRKRIVSLALCCIMIFTLWQPVFALSELEWTGAAGDGSWHTADNWDLEQVPEDGDYVIIPEFSVVEYVYGETSVRLNCAGNLTVSGGTLKMTNSSLSENSSLINGKLDGAGDITITNGSSFVWIGGNIEGTGRLIIEDNANLYAKASSSLDRYLVNNGSLLIDVDGSLRLTGGAEGSGNFNIQGGQTLELGGSGSYNLSSNVNNFGTLKILNTCASAQFNSGYTQQNTGTLEFDIGGPSHFTPLEVAGTALLNGILKINILDGYIPSPGDTFEIMTYGSRAGTFSSFESNIPEITFEPTYTDTGLTLTVNDGPASGGYLCKVDEVGYDTLDGALEAVMYGGTIQLLGNIDYDGGLVIDGADITFDLNGYTLNVNSSTYSVPGVGLEVKNGGNVFLIGSGQFNVRQISDGTCYGVKVSDASTAMVTNIQVTLLDDGSAFGAYADGKDSSIHVLGNVHVTGEGGCGARTLGRGRITVDGTITAMAYINIGYTNKDKSSGVDDPDKPGYLKYCTEPITGIVWVKAPTVTVPSAPQNFTATPGDGQVTLSWTAPASDGGAAISHYEVSADDGTTWVTASTSTSHTFTGLTNGTTYTFKVRAVNSVGNGAEASVSAIPTVLEFAGGDGSEEEPYLIETVDQLNNVRNYLGKENSDKHFKLNANLNLDVAPYNSDTGWQPIGTSASPFTGTFDGGGHTISGLTIDKVGTWNVRTSFRLIRLYRHRSRNP